MDITYKKITTGLRPLRIAVFFDKNSPKWRLIVEGIIELFSTVWGGKYNIIVPTDGKTIEDHFLQILKEFDPDICCYYAYTNLDFLYSIEGLEEKERMIEAIMDKALLSKAEAELRLIANNTSDEIDIFKENAQLLEIIKSELTFFSNKDNPKLIKWHWRTRKPLGSLRVEDYLSEVKDLIGSFYYFNYDECSENCRLLLASYTGLGNYLYSKKLDVRVIPIDKEKEMSLIKELYDNSTSHATPFVISGYGTSETIDFFKVGTENIPYILIVGSSASDYAYFYGLSKVMHGVYWLPSLDCFDESHTELGFITLMKIIDDSLISGLGLINVTSCSLSRNEIIPFVTQIKNLPIPEITDEHLNIEIVEAKNISIKRYFHVYEQGSAYNTYIQQFDDGVSTNFIQSPYPKRFKSVPAHKADWVIDYQIEGLDKDGSTAGHILPDDHILISNLFDNISFYKFGSHYLRKSGNKYSIRCPFQTLRHVQMTLEEITPSPILRLQGSFEIFKHIFSKNGYTID